MNKLKKADFIIIAVALLIIAGIVLSVFAGSKNASGANEQAAADQKPAATYDDYNGKKMGIRTGSSFEALTLKYFPDSEYQYYDTDSDLIAALTSNKIDGFLNDEPVAAMIHVEHSDVDYIRKLLIDDDYSFGFQKDTERSNKLRAEFNETLAKLRESGELDKMKAKWMSKDESIKVYDDSPLTGENGTVFAAVVGDKLPFSYVSNNKLTGYNIELLTIFAREHGYKLEYDMTPIAGMLAGIASGKYDIGAGTLSITEERKKTIDFSDCIYEGGVVLIGRPADLGPQEDSNEPLYKEFTNKRVGIMTGSNFEPASFKYFPDAEYIYYDSQSDLITALVANKIDCFLADEPLAAMAHSEQPEIDYLREPVEDDDYHFGFQKGTERSILLQGQFNEFLAKCRTDGKLDELKHKWIDGPESGRKIGTYNLTGANGTIVAVCLPDLVPFSYNANNELSGYAVELTYMFAEEYGYNLTFEQTNISSCIAGLSTGKYDLIADSLSYTEERAQSIDFSDVFYDGGIVMMARSDDLKALIPSSGPDYRDFDGKRAGIRTGSSFDPLTPQFFPNSEYFYFESDSDLITALITNKIDFFLNDQPVAALEHIQQSSVDYIHEPIMDDDYHFGFQKDNERAQALKTQFNEFLARYRSDGRLAALKTKWIDGEESQKVLGSYNLTGENGNITVAVVPDNIPFSYTANNELTGYAVELSLAFASEYGYTITFEQANTASCLAGLSGGKYDIFAYSLSYTEERAKSIDYSDVFYNGGVVLVARSSDLSANGNEIKKDSFITSIMESFEKNFITESRYQLILQGIGTTSIITVLSVIFGSILAFFICLFRRTDSLLANKIANLYVKLLQGTPLVVLLMILYYVVFGKSGISSIWVAVIGFSLNFGAYTSEILRSGIESIDGGQREAALALGYSENQAFFKFIFPQASVRQIPVYRGEIISLLKNTSIVGYIAIQDLTKMSDIIRSRTYEAFFPLIATAIIYFILAWIIALILNLVLKKIDPRAKKARFAKEAAAK